MGYHRKRETDGQKEGGRMQCFMKKEDKSLIDVEHVETTYFDNSVSLPHLPPFFVSSISVLVLSHSVQLKGPVTRNDIVDDGSSTISSTIHRRRWFLTLRR